MDDESVSLFLALLGGRAVPLLSGCLTPSPTQKRQQSTAAPSPVRGATAAQSRGSLAAPFHVAPWHRRQSLFPHRALARRGYGPATTMDASLLAAESPST